MRAFGSIFMLLMFICINYYLGLKLFQCLKCIFPKVSVIICFLVFLILFVIMIIGFVRSLLPLSESVKHILAICSSYIMGFYIYLFLFCLLGDLFVFLIKLFKFEISNVRLYSYIGVVVLTLCTFIYGLINGNSIKHVSYDVKLDEKHEISDMNIVMISDLHIGAINSENRLKKIVSEINSLDADLVLISGDIFDNDYYAIRDVEGVINSLSSIKSTYGVYASLGNHDSGGTFDKMMNILDKSNIKVLMDESVVIDERLVVLGRLDGTPIGGYRDDIARGEVDNIISGVDSSLPLIVLDHNPINIDEYDNRVDLILSGHTHRGQLFPANIVTDLMYEVDYGYYNNSGIHVIVSSGVGTWSMPMRVGSYCEIVSINIK